MTDLVKMKRGDLVAQQHPDMVKALLATGWEIVDDAAPIPEPVKAELTKSEVEIPDDWETAHHFTKIKIARNIDPEFKGSSQDAEALIRKTLEARQSLS